jgi:hypothetical protein
VSVGTLSVAGYGLTLVTAMVPEHGRPLDIPILVQEMLGTTGVDYNRWRQMHLRYQPYRLVTLSAFSTYAAAITAAQQVELGAHRRCRLQWTLGNVSRSFRDVRILGAPRLKVSAGYIAGGGTSVSGVGGLLFGDFELQHTETSSL